MDALETIRAIESRPDFLRWKESNPSAYLTSAFSMFSEGSSGDWLISFYNPDNDIMGTFSINEAKSHEEPFSKEGSIPELVQKNVKISDEKALDAASAEFRKSQGSEPVQKTIIVLQKLNARELWNITFITAAFKVVNIKVSASSGAVIDTSVNAITDFMKKD